jgi:hypothetical protein
MRELVSTSVAVRLQPESTRRRGQNSFAEYFSTAWEKPTPVVRNAQRRLIHKGNPRSSSSCYVNFTDVAFRPFSRCSVRLFPSDPPFGRTYGAVFF